LARILITGARAPVALDWARNLNKFGHQVYAADSLKYPLSRNTAAIADYVELPEPRNNLPDYFDALSAVCTVKQIDIILPWLKPRLQHYSLVVCPDFELISALHSKKVFLEMAENLGMGIPKTQEILGLDIKNLTCDFDDFVIKKEFCRFGTDVKVAPSRSYVEKLNDEKHYLLQERVSTTNSTELCSYGIACDGKLLAHAIYEPTYRVKQSSGIYFKNVVSEQIFAFISQFVAKYQYTGQIGFDFIVNGDEIYVLECNPRATSGLHLLSNQDIFQNLLDSMSGDIQDCITPNRNAAMIGAAMLLIDFPQALFKGGINQWFADYKKAEDIIVVPNDNSFWLYQFKSIGELVTKAVQQKISVRAASTMDIEWDGEEMLPMKDATE
jgi:hypothetical protein